MPYNETFEKLKAAQNPAFAEEIEAVKDNQTFFIGAYESSSEGNIPKGDFNEIFQALLNNDKALKILVEAIQARTITAGKGLQGGGNLTSNRTIDVVAADDSITVGADNIKVNTYNGVDSTSTTRPASANAVRQANNNANNRVSKSGDTMTNTLNIKRNGIKVINFQEADESSTQVGYVGFGSGSTPREIQLRNAIAGETFAIAEDGEYQFPTKTTTSSIDANDIIPSSDKRGIIYRIGNNQYIGANFPEGAGAGILRVWRSYNTHIVQEYYNIAGAGNPSAWYRISSSSTNWSAWKKLITSTDIINDLTTGGADKVASGETVKTLNSTKASKNGDTFTGLIKMKMARPYIEFLNTSNERMGYIGYGATDNTKLQIINSLKSKENVSNTLEVFNDGSLAIPYESIPTNDVVDANDLIPPSDVSTKIYRIYSPSVVINGSNFPSGAGAGFLRVTRTYNTQITQEYFDTTKKNTYIRYKVSDWSRWSEVLSDDSPIFLGNAGMPSIRYIQDAGEKTAGNGYVDKTTGQLYLCKTTNSDTSVTSNFVLATNIEIAKRQHFTKTILFDKPTGHGSGAITLSDNWENYDEFIVYGSSDNADYVGSHRFKKEDIEYSISKNQRYIIYGEANDYWLAKITTGSKTWASGNQWENCAIFRIIGIKYGG